MDNKVKYEVMIFESKGGCALETMQLSKPFGIFLVDEGADEEHGEILGANIIKAIKGREK